MDAKNYAFDSLKTYLVLRDILGYTQPGQIEFTACVLYKKQCGNVCITICNIGLVETRMLKLFVCNVEHGITEAEQEVERCGIGWPA